MANSRGGFIQQGWGGGRLGTAPTVERDNSATKDFQCSYWCYHSITISVGPRAAACRKDTELPLLMSMHSAVLLPHAGEQGVRSTEAETTATTRQVNGAAFGAGTQTGEYFHLVSPRRQICIWR